MNESLVELIDVHRRYAGTVAALRGVTLSIEPGELVGIVGPSGSGKSTMLHLMGTLDRPDAGRVRIDGQDVTELDDRKLSRLRARTIGFVFQQFHLPTGVPAVDAVADGLVYAGVPRATRRERAARVLERLGLGHRLGHRPDQLSGGEQQRVAVARACVGSPALLLADEPTGNLDSAAGDELVEVLFDLCAQGTAVVVVTHNLDLAGQLPRRVEVKDGLVREDRLTEVR
ncbi:ABC transporter ATP-binding protein [Tenggerimyces flavus]|uniref:ABC transporter ATP-binding protein n=1 Tax=Tenggerimyces flavus TaxID=1708749 RepID=A0ABV7YCK0_9ACTN|nr:ABC transporter ATP-binding protein [Tenggerimyces flavus]MBM7789775.1 putative ABC transport system ATP-binding protein [Tenggerimyces flavus]